MWQGTFKCLSDIVICLCRVKLYIRSTGEYLSRLSLADDLSPSVDVCLSKRFVTSKGIPVKHLSSIAKATSEIELLVLEVINYFIK